MLWLHTKQLRRLCPKRFVDAFSGSTKPSSVWSPVVPLRTMMYLVSFEVSWTKSRTSPAINSVGKAGPTKHMWGQILRSEAHCGEKRPAWLIALLKPNHCHVLLPDTVVSLGGRAGNRRNKDWKTGLVEKKELGTVKFYLLYQVTQRHHERERAQRGVVHWGEEWLHLWGCM